MSVALRDGLKVLEGLALGKDAEFEFVACYVEECVFRAEDLAEQGVIKLVESRPRDAYKGEFHWKKGDGDLHNPGEDGRGGRGGKRRTTVYDVPLPGRSKPGIFGLAKDLPSFAS